MRKGKNFCENEFCFNFVSKGIEIYSILNVWKIFKKST